MTPGAHRVVFYWVLLLLPTLAASGGALWLLRREQTRLDDQARAAASSRIEALTARTRLIAENVELLVGDVQSGLMNTLQEAPAVNSDRFLDEWEKANPLVKATFRLAANGSVVRPVAGNGRDMVRIWLSAWQTSKAVQPAAKLEKRQQDSAEAERQRGDVSANVTQIQSARNVLKDVASQKNVASSPRLEENAAVAPEQTGWDPWRDGKNLHLIGWRKLASGIVLGVEVKLEAVADRLGDVLPKDKNLADAFALREAGGATLQSSSYLDSSLSRSSKLALPATVTVPIATNILPGWEIAAFAAEETYVSSGSGFFLIGALLVGIFVIAILSGGSLLVWQARRSEAEAVQKTSFVANVSHEFKTPLTTIRLYSELLEQGRVRDETQRDEYLRTIGRETERLARLVNNALDFSRLEQGQKKYARESLDLGAELNRLLDTHAPRVAEAGLMLHREIPSTPVGVQSDRDALGQIVLNLVDNACKYAGSGGQVTVAVVPSTSGRGAEVRVSDRGPGVPPDHRERIFEKFHRIDDALTADKGGAGLGLSIARQLARGLGGDLRVEARSGGGAEFVLTVA